MCLTIILQSSTAWESQVVKTVVPYTVYTLQFQRGLPMGYTVFTLVQVVYCFQLQKTLQKPQFLR